MHTFSGNGRQLSYLSVRGYVRGNAVELMPGSKKFGAAALKAGETVGPHHPFNVQALMVEDCVDSCKTFSGPWQNHGKGVENRYLGLKFDIGGLIHYGWARFSIHMRPPFYAHLTGYAYETLPWRPIITGKTKGPDVITVQPGSLGSLAAGVARPHR